MGLDGLDRLVKHVCPLQSVQTRSSHVFPFRKAQLPPHILQPCSTHRMAMSCALHIQIDHDTCRLWPARPAKHDEKAAWPCLRPSFIPSRCAEQRSTPHDPHHDSATGPRLRSPHRSVAPHVRPPSSVAIGRGASDPAIGRWRKDRRCPEPLKASVFYVDWSPHIRMEVN